MQSIRSLITKLMLAALCLGTVGYAAQSDKRTTTINEDGVRRTIDCRGDAIVVTGDRNTLTLRGDCSNLNLSGDENVITAAAITNIGVSGDSNKITVETTDALRLSGDDNDLKWSKTTSGARPKISNTGKRNTISQYKK